MPIYEYRCRPCDRAFEVLVQGSKRAACPHCGGRSLDKLLSVFATASSDGAAAREAPGGCGSCGDPRGPGSCNLD